jgi:hypothetical protein
MVSRNIFGMTLGGIGSVLNPGLSLPQTLR